MDREPYIPYEISNLAINYSIPLFFIGGLVSTICGQRILGFTQFAVYATSILFWSHIEKYGFYRNLDRVCAVLCLSWSIYVVTYLIPNVRYVWYYTLGTSFCVYAVNEAVFYISMEYCIDEGWRTYMTYQSVIIHMGFLHILLSIVSMYCVITGKPIDKIK